MNSPLPSFVTALTVVSLVPGCLSNVYEIRKADLIQATQVAPEERGRQVPVEQKFSGSDGPPPADRVDGHVGVYVHVDAGTHYSPRPYSRAHTRNPGRHGNAAKLDKEDSKFLIVLAALAAVGLAATEGARFDGWAELHPMHPVHLFGWDGGYMAVPLAHITPEHAQWARKALIRESEGPMRRLSRRPLDRTGLNYSVLLGQGEIGSSLDEATVGFTGHIQLGLFPTHQLGFLYDLSLGFTDDEFGDTISDVRNSFELQFFPAAVGRLHAGAFGQVGIGRRLDDSLKGSDRQGFLFGGGGLVQLDVTTTLALTARAGATVIFGEPVRDFTVGLSIY